MTTGLTLFGGLAVVLVFYAVLRSVRVLPELAGLIAALVPLFAYIATLFGHWPGLDVVAIHVAVFLIAAFVLVVFSRYRAKQSRMHWVPKALIAFFLMLIVMNAGFLYVSTQGLPPELSGILLPGEKNTALHTGFSGATRHGEEAAKAISSDLATEHRNEQLGWNVRVEGLRMPSVGGNMVTIFAEDNQGRTLGGLVGSVEVSRPGAKGERFPLRHTSGQYEASLEFPASGLWIVKLELDNYRQSWEVTVP